MQNGNESSASNTEIVELQNEVDLIRRQLRPSLFWSEGGSTMAPANPASAGRFVFQEWIGISIPLIIVLVWYSIHIAFNGYSFSSIFLVLGSIISFVCIFLFGGNIIAVFGKASPPATRKELLLLISLMMPPYFFGLLLVVYFGIFRLIFSFSIIQLIQSVVLCLLGLQIMWKSRMLQEFYFEVVRTEVEVRASQPFPERGSV